MLLRKVEWISLNWITLCFKIKTNPIRNFLTITQNLIFFLVSLHWKLSMIAGNDDSEIWWYFLYYYLLLLQNSHLMSSPTYLENAIRKSDELYYYFFVTTKQCGYVGNWTVVCLWSRQMPIMMQTYIGDNLVKLCSLTSPERENVKYFDDT